jgi:hypothetical protein
METEKITNIKLESCYRCSNKLPDLEVDPGTPDYYYMSCSNVTCRLSTINFPTKEEAIENWNKWNKSKKYQKLEK